MSHPLLQPKRLPPVVASTVWVLAALTIGCNSENPQAGSQSAVADPIVNSVSSRAADTDVRPAADASQTLDQAAGSPAFPDLDAPLADDAQFFAPPKMETPTQQVMPADQGRASIRLLGFVGDDSVDADARKAILKVGGKMVTIGRGESIEGIELLSIQGRSITMQRDRDRWTLSLFDQPLVNQPTVRRNHHAKKRRSTNSARNSTRRNAQPQAIEFPSGETPALEAPALGMPAHLDPLADLPEPPAPPDLSDLPGIEDLPGI